MTLPTGDIVSRLVAAQSAATISKLGRIFLVLLLFFLVWSGPGPTALFEQWWLPVIGVGGALVANSTGIGGGVVFVPAFDQIGLAEIEIVGTSLIIQSFGMTMGALTFIRRSHGRWRSAAPGSLSNLQIVGVVCALALPAAWVATLGGLRPDVSLHNAFKVISLGLLALIVGSSFLRISSPRPLSWAFDGPVLAVIGIVGGCFVGWISIGVGELVAVYLLLRGMWAIDAVGIAVIVTAVTVVLVEILFGAALSANRTVALLVAPGALLGGFLAPYILDIVGDARAKWFCAFWIFLSCLNL